MSKLVLFLFLGVCVMAVHMEAVNSEGSDDEQLDALIDTLESELKEELLQEDPRINWKKVWGKITPVLKEAGKIAKPIVTEAAKAAAAAAAGGYVNKGGK